MLRFSVGREIKTGIIGLGDVFDSATRRQWQVDGMDDAEFPAERLLRTGDAGEVIGKGHRCWCCR